MNGLFVVVVMVYFVGLFCCQVRFWGVCRLFGMLVFFVVLVCVYVVCFSVVHGVFFVWLNRSFIVVYVLVVFAV